MTPDPPEPPVPVDTMNFTITNGLNNAQVFAVTAIGTGGELAPVPDAPVYRVKGTVNVPVTINAVIDSYIRFGIWAVAYDNSKPDLSDYALSDMTLCTWNGSTKTFFVVSGKNVAANYSGSGSGTATQSS